MDRREFFHAANAVGALATARVHGASQSTTQSARSDRDAWIELIQRLADIGFCGHQPGVGETYISTGSLYLCSVGLLPLGLPATDEFWSAPPQPWTAVKAWSGQPFPIDHAL